MQLCSIRTSLQRFNSLRKQLLAAPLESQHVGGGQLMKHSPQRGSIGPEEEELPPEALCLVSIIIFFLFYRNKSAGGREIVVARRPSSHTCNCRRQS